MCVRYHPQLEIRLRPQRLTTRDRERDRTLTPRPCAPSVSSKHTDTIDLRVVTGHFGQRIGRRGT